MTIIKKILTILSLIIFLLCLHGCEVDNNELAFIYNNTPYTRTFICPVYSSELKVFGEDITFNDLSSSSNQDIDIYYTLIEQFLKSFYRVNYSINNCINASPELLTDRLYQRLRKEKAILDFNEDVLKYHVEMNVTGFSKQQYYYSLINNYYGEIVAIPISIEISIVADIGFEQKYLSLGNGPQAIDIIVFFAKEPLPKIIGWQEYYLSTKEKKNVSERGLFILNEAERNEINDIEEYPIE